jgi:hypothetical protein
MPNKIKGYNWIWNILKHLKDITMTT